CAVEMSAFYLDVLKDRLYTAAADGRPRRAAQTALHHIAHSLARLFAPILSFTAEEVWAVLSGSDDDSVFLHTWHELPPVADADALEARWSVIRRVRADVQKRLEELRVASEIGSSLAASVEVRLRAPDYDVVASLGDDLRLVLLTSHAEAVKVERAEDEGIAAIASPHRKCERCWHYRADVGADPKHPALCGRCVANLFGDGEPRTYA
ncbi:MAG TPA: class I tRNA ligase family protein, partial [Pelomicrobium sp.]|nr:class I tRNA ligase family protein [Pelomicrobium sp.]